MKQHSEASTPSVKNILCVLSEQQANDFEPDLQALQGPNVEVLMETSAQDALGRIGDVNPRLVIAGMDLGEMEGLEFLALLMRRYPDFYNKVVVLPDRTDPFPPVLQYRDRATGRSVTEQTDWDGVVDLARRLATAPPSVAPQAAPEPEAQAALPVADADAAAVDEWSDAFDVSLPPAAAPDVPPVHIPVASPLPEEVPNAGELRFESASATEAAEAAPAPSLSPSLSPAIVRGKLPLPALIGAGVVVLVLVLWALFGGSSEDEGSLEAAANEQPTETAEAPTGESAAAQTVAKPATARAAPQQAAAPAEKTQAPAPTEKPSAAKPARAAADLPELRDGITLPLRFGKGHATFVVADRAELDRILAAAGGQLAENSKARLEVGGHTSKEGSASNNQRLGRRRAQAVQELLAKHGFASPRLVVKSYGESAVRMGIDGHTSSADLRRVTLKLLR